MNTRFCIDSRIACHAFVAIAALTVGTAAYAGSVTVTGAFAQYVGAVQNGGPPNATFLTFINGAMVAPSEPLPGLESSFTPADPNDPDSVAMGLGRATVDLGGVNAVEFHVARVDDQGVATDDVSNLLAFTPGPAAEVGIGDEFLLGTFTLQNGVFFAADPIHRFSFSLTTSSASPELNGKVFSDTIILNITGNCFVQPACLNAGRTPETNADNFYFDQHRELGTMSVYELADSPSPLRNFGSIDLYGRIGSLIPTRLANAQGGVFLGPAVALPPSADVAAPDSLATFAAGLLAVVLLRGQRRLRL